MRYELLDVELAGDWPDVVVRADRAGVAILWRLNGRPVGFSMHRHSATRQPAVQDLIKFADRDVADAVCAQSIRDGLVEPSLAGPCNPTVAICTHDRVSVLEPCLRSVLALDSVAELEVLVIDNDPPDDSTRRLVASLPRVRYVHEPRRGLDFARNRALSEAGGGWVAFIDDDVVVDREWLRGLEEAVVENPDAGIITGLVLPYELDTRAQIVFERRGGFRRGCQKLRFEGDHQPDAPLYPLGAGMFGAGANMVVNREVALDIGGFDEALDTGAPLPGGGDLDIFSRVIRSGRPIAYEPRMLVFHRHRQSLAELRRQYFSWGTGFMAYLSKTYEVDPDTRRKLRGLILWWLRYEMNQTANNLVGRGWGSPDLALAELAGGFVGLFGGYGRSRRRVAAIKEQVG